MSNGPKFFQTIMGKQFFEGTMPKLARSLERIAVALEKTVVEPDYVKRAEKINNLFAFKVRNNDWPSVEALEEFLRELDKEKT